MGADGCTLDGWGETSLKQKVVCLIVALPSIIPIAHDLKLDARCKGTM